MTTWHPAEAISPSNAIGRGEAVPAASLLSSTSSTGTDLRAAADGEGGSARRTWTPAARTPAARSHTSMQPEQATWSLRFLSGASAILFFRSTPIMMGSSSPETSRTSSCACDAVVSNNVVLSLVPTGVIVVSEVQSTSFSSAQNVGYVGLLAMTVSYPVISSSKALFTLLFFHVQRSRALDEQCSPACRCHCHLDTPGLQLRHSFDFFSFRLAIASAHAVSELDAWSFLKARCAGRAVARKVSHVARKAQGILKICGALTSIRFCVPAGFRALCNNSSRGLHARAIRVRSISLA